jgi:hypothetical protein
LKELPLKNLLAITCLLTISATAFGQSKSTYDFSAVGLLNRVQDCSAELAAATKGGQMVLGAEEFEAESETTSLQQLDLTIGFRYPPPSFGERPTAKLSVIRKAKRAAVIAADAGPNWQKTVCKVTPIQ